jgi:hypothetical protein
MQNTYEMIQGQAMKQEAKFDLLLDQIKSLGNHNPFFALLKVSVD